MPTVTDVAFVTAIEADDNVAVPDPEPVRNAKIFPFDGAVKLTEVDKLVVELFVAEDPIGGINCPNCTASLLAVAAGTVTAPVTSRVPAIVSLPELVTPVVLRA